MSTETPIWVEVKAIIVFNKRLPWTNAIEKRSDSSLQSEQVCRLRGYFPAAPSFRGFRLALSTQAELLLLNKVLAQIQDNKIDAKSVQYVFIAPPFHYPDHPPLMVIYSTWKYVVEEIKRCIWIYVTTNVLSHIPYCHVQ